MTTVEQQARREWIGTAAQQHYGTCDSCGRNRDENDRPLIVARGERRRKFLCLDCFDARRRR